MTQVNKKGTITIYGVGGAGINQAYMFEAMRSAVNQEGMAEVQPVYADTSRANLRPDILDHSFFQFNDVNDVAADGSGGIRATNAQTIQAQIGSLVDAHKPGYAAIIIHSASGGSGSVIGPVLAQELRERGHDLVVSIIIGDASTTTSIRNTLNTVATYELMSENLNKAMATAYFENDASNTRMDVDSQVFRLVTNLAGLFSRENAELDTMDLVHLLNIERSTSYDPHLVRLEVRSGDLSDENIGDDATTVVSLLASREHNPMTAIVDHAKAGYRPTSITQDAISAPVHFIVRAYAFNDVAERLRAKIKERDAARAARTVGTSLTQGVVRKSGSSLVL